MTSAAYELEAQSRRIWSLRIEHAWEFEGFSESGHQSVVSRWQAQFDLWADTVVDIQEGHFDPSDANLGSNGSIPMNAAWEGWDSQKHDGTGNPMIDSNIPANMPVQAPQISQMQNLSLAQTASPQHNTSGFQGSQSKPPDAFPQSSPAAQSHNTVKPGFSMGYQQQSPQAQQMPTGQTTKLNIGSSAQSGQSSQKPGSFDNQ